MRRRTPGWLGPLAVATALLLAPARGWGQSLEPRAYSPAPVGMNFLIVGWAWTEGGLWFDSGGPIVDPKLTTTGPILAYARTLDIFGKSGKFDVILPGTQLSGSALYRGEPVERDITGLSDPLARLSVSLLGAPAMSAKQFRSYRQDVVVGASLQVSVPVGQYDSSRLINLGTNRWIAKPEIGVSKTWGRWTVEGDAAVCSTATTTPSTAACAGPRARCTRPRAIWFTASGPGFGRPPGRHLVHRRPHERSMASIRRISSATGVSGRRWRSRWTGAIR